MLEIKDLKVSVDPSASSGQGSKEILKGINLEVGAGRRPGRASGPEGEIHVLMGPNASGKSTLAHAVMGHPKYRVEGGGISFEGKDITKLSPDKRAKLGIFLAFQNPTEVPGVNFLNFLRIAKKGQNGKSEEISFSEFRKIVEDRAKELKIPNALLKRSLNEGFSGGEKKRSEMFQLSVLEPKLAILDEIDSGLDVDALKLVANAIKQFSILNSQSSVLLITHYARILKYLKPDFVHIMRDGQIVESGGPELAERVEEKGFESFKEVVSYGARTR